MHLVFTVYLLKPGPEGNCNLSSNQVISSFVSQYSAQQRIEIYVTVTLSKQCLLTLLLFFHLKALQACLRNNCISGNLIHALLNNLHKYNIYTASHQSITKKITRFRQKTTYGKNKSKINCTKNNFNDTLIKTLLIIT